MDIDWRRYIHSDPEVLLGKPAVKGTRLSVEFILGLFAEGWTEQQVLENYPTLTVEGLRAVLPLQQIACVKNRYMQFNPIKPNGFSR